MNEIVTGEHMNAVRKFRRLYTLLKENEMIIRIGAYTKGSDPELDEAIAKKKRMEEFMSQNASLSITFEETIKNLITLMNAK